MSVLGCVSFGPGQLLRQLPLFLLSSLSLNVTCIISMFHSCVWCFQMCLRNFLSVTGTRNNLAVWFILMLNRFLQAIFLLLHTQQRRHWGWKCPLGPYWTIYRSQSLKCNNVRMHNTKEPYSFVLYSVCWLRSSATFIWGNLLQFSRQDYHVLVQLIQ